MELNFSEFALTIEASNIDVPFGLSDELLFIKIKSHLIDLLSDNETKITNFFDFICLTNIYTSVF